MNNSATLPGQSDLTRIQESPNQRNPMDPRYNYQNQIIWNNLMTNFMQNMTTNQVKFQPNHRQNQNKPQNFAHSPYNRPSKSRKRSFSKSDSHSLNDETEHAHHSEENDKPKLKTFKFISKKSFPIELKGYVKLQKELKRCLGTTNSIINAYINDKSELIIKIKEENENDLLKAIWPKDAFTHGVTYIEKKDPAFYFALNYVSLDFDVNDEDNREYMLNEYNIIKMVRMTKKSTNTPLKTIKCLTNNKDTYSNIIKKGKITIGKTIVKVTPWDFGIQPNQCFHCQRIGHQRASCPNKDKKPTCVRCSGEHEHNKCPVKDPKQFKCVNCGLQHASCSRDCEELKKEIERKRKELETRTKKDSNFTRIYSDSNAKYPLNQKRFTDQNNQFEKSINNLLELFITMIKNLNEVTAWISENPRKLTKLIEQKMGPIFAKSTLNFLLDNIDIEEDENLLPFESNQSMSNDFYDE